MITSPISQLLQPMQNRYKISISRRRPVQSAVEEQRILPVLPREVPEKGWSDILAKEETELIIFDIREEIYDDAMRLAYEGYIERQLSPFTISCVAQAYLKLVDWAFFRHDPGEDPTNYPPSYIPKRPESWIPDEMPDTSPKDTWAREKLCCDEDSTMYPVKQWPSNSSLDMPVIEDIPKEYWFPGKINFPRATEVASVDTYTSQIAEAADSEVLQKVTDYNSEEKEQSGTPPSLPKLTTPISHPESSVVIYHKKPKHSLLHIISNLRKSRTKSSTIYSRSRSDGSYVTPISDCQMKNPRMETTYELSSQVIEQPELTAQSIKKSKNP